MVLSNDQYPRIRATKATQTRDGQSHRASVYHGPLSTLLLDLLRIPYRQQGRQKKGSLRQQSRQKKVPHLQRIPYPFEIRLAARGFICLYLYLISNAVIYF